MFDQHTWQQRIAEQLSGFARDPRQEVQLAGAHGLLPYLVIRTLEPFLEAFHATPVEAVVTLATLARGPGADFLVQQAMRRRYMVIADIERDLRNNADLRVTVEHLLVELQTIHLALRHLNTRRSEWLRATLEREINAYTGAFARLRSVVRDSDGHERADALRRLRARNGRYTADDLLLIDAALVDNAARVRAGAARLLGISADAPPAPLVARLLQVALRDSDAETRFAAARALGLLRERVVTHELLEQVEGHLFHDDSFYRSAAALVLGQLGERAGSASIVASLSSMLNDLDPYAREAAARALGRIGYPAAVPEVMEALTRAAQDGDVQVHEAALDSLAILRQVPEPTVRAAA
ncbi:MAG: HEAT repeat domain-containing protein [Chloroflexi bacterium]|nr:HEAT repeat domain-containing protein [Chloroflexota bacterium]